MNDDTRRNAEEAATILESHIFRKAMDDLDRQAVAAWRDAKTPEEREYLHLKQAVIADLCNELLRYVEKAAKQELHNNENGPFRAFFARWRHKNKE